MIAPPAGSSTEGDNTDKISTDLKMLAAALITADYQSTFKKKVEETWRAIPDSNVSCQMLLQTTVCLGMRPDADARATGQILAFYVVSSDACRPVASPPIAESRPKVEGDLTGDWVGLSSQIVKPPKTREIQEQLFHLQNNRGIVTSSSTSSEYRWIQTGYLRDGNLVLAYETDLPQGRGFGTFLLKDQYGTGNVFFGFVTGRDCLIDKVVRYPFVLVRGNPGSDFVTRAKLKYEAFIDGPYLEVDDSLCPK